MAVLTLRGELDAHGAPRLKVLSGALEHLREQRRAVPRAGSQVAPSWTPRRSGRWWVRCAGCARAGGEMRVVLPETAGTADLRDHRPRGRAQRLPDARDRAPGRPSGLTVGAVQAPDNDVVAERLEAFAALLELAGSSYYAARLPPRRPDREGDQGVGRRARAEWACRRAPRRRAGDRCACPELAETGRIAELDELERTVQPGSWRSGACSGWAQTGCARSPASSG